MPNLSVTQWAEIRARYEQGEPANEIAPDYGIKHKTIYTKACRQKWRERPSARELDRLVLETRIAQKAERQGISPAEAVTLEANERGRVIESHRLELDALGKQIEASLEKLTSSSDLDIRSHALCVKTLIDSTVAKQQAERKAWSLDLTQDDPSKSQNPVAEVLDALYEAAMTESERRQLEVIERRKNLSLAGKTLIPVPLSDEDATQKR
jgi:hypothetical protein